MTWVMRMTFYTKMTQLQSLLWFLCLVLLFFLSPPPFATLTTLGWTRLGWARLPPQALYPGPPSGRAGVLSGWVGVGRKPFSGSWLPQLHPKGRLWDCMVYASGLAGWWGATAVLGEEGEKTFSKPASHWAFRAFIPVPKSFLCSLNCLRWWGLSVAHRQKVLPQPTLPAACVVISCFSITRILS